MRRLCVALVTFGIAVASVGCSGAASGPAAAPTTAAAPSAAPSVAATAPPSVAPTASPATAPAISLAEWKVVVSGTIKSGKTELKINDNGVAAHELLIFKSDLAPSAYPTDKSGDIVEDGPGISLLSDGENIDPGGTQSRTVDLAPGTYLFVCNIPGHFKQGMFTVVTVTP
jgi:uncharacterized cupredoxin-like copper-binding protein